MALTKNKHTRTEKSGWCRVIWGWQWFKTELQGRARVPRLVPDVPKNKIKKKKMEQSLPHKICFNGKPIAEQIRAE